MEVKFKKMHPNAKHPKRGSKYAGGWDVVATEIEQINEDLVVCKLGFGLEFDETKKLTLVPRSSLTNTKWVLQNSPGLGDCDFSGQYMYKFRAFPDGIDTSIGNGVLTYPEFPYKEGDRIGQIYLEEVIPMEFEDVDELSETERGEGGFGSTGLGGVAEDEIV